MEKQPELFGEFKDTGQKKKFFQNNSLAEKVIAFNLTQEKFILLILIFIIILAVVFAVGFEQGRRRTKVLPRRPVPVGRVPTPQALTRPQQPLQPKRVSIPASPKPYTIQVATYKSKQYAQEDAAKLKNKGFSTTVIGINGLYQVWVGEYATQNEAAQALSILRKTYKDCHVRKR